MSFFRPSTATIGVDIGSHSVKAIQLFKKGPSDFRLTALRVAVVEQNQKDPREAALSALTTILKDFDLKKNRLVTSLGGSSLVIKQVPFPTASPKEIESSLPWEASQHIPRSLDAVELRYQIKKIHKDEKGAEVLLAAVEKEDYQNHLNLLNRLNLQPIIVDANPLALANAFLTLTPETEGKSLPLIELGARFTTISIFRQGGFFFNRDISLGGNQFTRLIQEKHQLEYTQAEQFKEQGKAGLDFLKALFQQLLLEIRQSLLFYDTRTGNKGFEEIILTGGSAHLSGLSSFLEENLSLPVNYFKPLKNIQIDDGVDLEILEKWESRLGVAIGLALRG